MYCADCGAFLPENSKFCGRCGNADQMIPVYTSQNYRIGKKKIAIIGVALMILLAVGSGVFFMMQNNKNKNWAVSKEIHYNSDGSIKEEREYRYDHDGKKVEMIRQNYLDDDTWKSTYEYDVSGNLTRETTIDIENPDYEIIDIYEYNSHNQMIRTEHRTTSLLMEGYVYEYDVEGRLILEKMDFGRLVTGYEYDSRGRLSKEVKYDEGYDPATATVKRWYEYEYDDSDRIIVKTEYITDRGKDNWIEYQYDKDGKLISEIECLSNTIKVGKYSQTDYTYDTKGNMIESYKHYTSHPMFGQDLYDPTFISRVKYEYIALPQN